MTDASTLSEIAFRLELSVAALERRMVDRYDDVLISCSEAARHLGCTPSTVTRMLKEGRLHRTTIDKSTGIRLSEIWEMKTQ